MKVIRNLDRGTANAIIYGFDNDNIDYFRNKYNILKSTLKNDNNEFTGFYNTLEYQNSDRYIAEIKSKMFELGVSGRDDINLYYFSSPNEANAITRDYIMANPILTNLYNRGLIDGYSGNYVHNEYDSLDRYMTIMNGEQEDDGDTFTTYYGHNEFSITEEDREIVRENWRNALKLWRKDIDPTL